MDEHKEIIFIWRSNVWKSSIMNALFNKKDMVKTSARPWKTKTANLFLMNNKFYFTDLPGYWFARLGKNFLEKLDALVSWYLDTRRDYIKTVCILIDSRIWVQQKDKDMFLYVQKLGIPINIVLSKIDKLWKSEVAKAKSHIEKEFFGQKVFAVSSLKKVWISELFNDLSDSLMEK
jgi:GTP-binding protein